MDASKTPYSQKDIWRYDLSQLEAQAQALHETGLIHATNLTHPLDPKSRKSQRYNLAFNTLRRFAALLPMGAGFWLFARLAGVFLLFAKRDARGIRKRLAAAMPELGEAELRAVYRSCVRALGWMIFETVSSHRLMSSLESRIEVVGADKIKALQATGKPLIFVHAHQAYWEIAFPIIGGTFGEFTGIYNTLLSKEMNLRILLQRVKAGARPYPRSYRSAIGLVMKDMKAGKPMIISLDQRYRGLVTDFMGLPAATPLVPARVADKVGADIIPIDIQRAKHPGTYRVVFHPPLDQGSCPEDAIVNYNALLGSWVRARPSDWLWIYNRWKKKDGEFVIDD